jgi:molecular chaperone DnaJ
MEINEAYQTLSDAQKRKQYDTFGNADFGNMGGGGGQGFGRQSSAGFDFGDIFGNM